MTEVNLTVHTFCTGTDKQAALKSLEKAAEAYAEWQDFDAYCETYNNPWSYEVRRDELGYEIADCIQACVNLADRYNIDLQAAIERCEERNRERGRYE